VLLVCLGNEFIHLMTYERRQVLRIDLGDWDGQKRFAQYDNFRVEDETKNFTLSAIGTFTGSAGRCDC